MRTIVSIEERNGELTARLSKTTLALPDAKKPVALKFSADTLPPLDSLANIKAYGDSLRNALMQHPAIQTALTNIAIAAPGPPQILCFEIDATEGERIRWEALCDPEGKFMGLDNRFHLGRIAEEASTSEASVRPFVPPLRVALFLSAAGVDAIPEWIGFASAFDTERKTGSPIEARVYVGQQELFDMITDEIGKGQHPGITVEAVPPSDVEVEQRLNDWSPHVVHFFCHGIVALGTGSLELATINEQALGAPGSVLINVDTLVNAEGLRDSWLVVLNCCQGGHAVEQLHSMAYSMVAKGGVPAAIGMLEPVTADDANAFCGSIYPEIFRTLRAALQLPPGAAPLAVNLSATMGAPRRTLFKRHDGVAANASRWTLPVLYLHNQPLQVHRPPLAAVGGGAVDECANVRKWSPTFCAPCRPRLPPMCVSSCLLRSTRRRRFRRQCARTRSGSSRRPDDDIAEHRAAHVVDQRVDGSRGAVGRGDGEVAAVGARAPHGGPDEGAKKVLGPAEKDERNWREPAVGWGLVLPDSQTLSPAQLATADDAPEPIRALLAARQPAPVLRYSANLNDASVLRYYTTGGKKPFSLVGSTPGVADDALPRYLLIYGGPDVIPWSFQYSANLTHHVGRLALDGVPLKRYVDALISDWAGMTSDPRAPVVWSASFGHPDITWLMDAAISRKVFASYAGDKDDDLLRRISLFDADATADKLVKTLAARSPSLVVTTSHGMTGPLDDAAKLAGQLGLLVDVDRSLVQPKAVLDAWRPNGAIWYSHACCSAGSDAPSCFADLLDPGSDVTAVLEGVAAASGSRVAPFPLALLGDERPLRAFVGHVEPTFDYTLRDPATGQPLTHSLRDALYDKLYAQSQRAPVAWALSQIFDDAGAMFGMWAQSVAKANLGQSAMRTAALYQQLTALDRQHTVVLGDPTVALPPLASTPRWRSA